MGTAERQAQLLGVDTTDPIALKVGMDAFLRQSSVTIAGVSSEVRIFEDFLGVGATLADNPLVLVTQTGTPTTAVAASSTVGPTGFAGARGWVTGSVQNVDAEIDTIALGKKPWMLVSSLATGQVHAAEIGFSVPTALTARQYFFGFSDVETIATAHNGVLNIQTGTTVVDDVTNGVGFVFSSLATGPTHYHMANTNAGTQAYIADSGLVAIADKYTRLRVEVDVAGNATFYGAVDTTRDATLPRVGGATLAVATTSILLPEFNAAPTTTTAVPYHIDYILGQTG